MRAGRALAVVAAAIVLGGGYWLYRRSRTDEAPMYRLASVERADLVATVSATGTLNAVTTVQVGTQVSGLISAIYVDFNDKVKKGQLLARIDPTLQRQAVADAEAGVAKAEAEYDAATREYDRNKALFDAQVITASEFNTINSTYRVAQANLTSARVTLDRARQNLAYTGIYAPIDGVIVSRDVDVGQTVAASFSAPQLFLIAQDLTDMQILASVDESDIGRIATGQTVSFTVTAYPDATFTGTVQQVRLQSATTENVVNYTVVVGVKNPEGKLLPGMTATVRFVTASAHDALVVPNAALRFQPTPAAAGTQRGTAGRAGRETIWRLDASGAPVPIRVRAGLTDGQRTQVEGAEVREGMPVIVGAIAQSEEGARAASPFQQPRQGPRRPPGAF